MLFSVERYVEIEAHSLKLRKKNHRQNYCYSDRQENVFQVGS